MRSERSNETPPRRQRAFRVAVQAGEDLKTAEAVAAAAAGTAAHRYTPESVAQRISTLEAAIGKAEQIRDGYTRTLFTDPGSHR